MAVREMKPGDELIWDNYVSKNEFSTPLQFAAWKSIFTKVYGSKTHFLWLEENGKVSGVLPLLHIKSLIAGNYVTSLPGGLLADDEGSANFLIAHAKNIVETENAKYLILRDGRRKWGHSELLTDDEHVNFIIDIHNDLNHVKNQMRSTTRKLLNRSLRNGLKGQVGWDFQDEFYQVYAASMHEIGNPSYGKRFFDYLGSAFQKRIHIVSLHHQGKILGGGYIAPLNQTMHCLWSGLLRDYYDLYISHFLYWEVVKFANHHGYETVNLGRCQKNSGLYFFKEGFGGKVQPLYQQFYLNGVQQRPPVGAEMEDDLKYQIFTKIWRLLPIQLTESIGPRLRKVMPFG